MRISAQARAVVPAPLFAMSRYTDAATTLVVAWKEHGDVGAARHMSLLLQRVVARAAQEFGADIVIPVPTHWRAALARGGDPLARGLAPVAPVVVRALKRGRTLDQVGLGESQRLANASAGFALSRLGRRVVPGAKVLVIDDVITTGSTLVTCGQVLAAAGWSVTALAAPFARRFD